MSFYTVNYLGELVSAPSVYAPEFTLTEDTSADFEYPVDGWYWFDTVVEATAILKPLSGVDPVIVAAETIQRHVDEKLAPSAVNTIAEVKTAIRVGLSEAVSELRGD